MVPLTVVALRLSSISRSAAPVLAALAAHLAIATALLVIPPSRTSAQREVVGAPREEVVEVALDVTTATRAPEPVAAPAEANTGAPRSGAASPSRVAEAHAASSGVPTNEAPLDHGTEPARSA